MRAFFILLFCTLTFSCTTNNIVADNSSVGSSPLEKLNLHFKINSVEEDTWYQKTNDSYAMEQFLYRNYPEFFKDSPQSLPIDIKLKGTSGHHQQEYVLLALCTGLFPIKETSHRVTHIEILPGQAEHAKMFHISVRHKIKNTNYISMFTPIAWMLSDDDGENKQVNHSVHERATEEFHRKFVAKKITSELSKLKLEIIND